MFDPYRNRYEIHRLTAYPKLFDIIDGESVLVTGLRAANNQLTKPVLATEKANFTALLAEIQTMATDPTYISDDEGKRKLLDIVHNRLVSRAPYIYSMIQHLNITTPGPSAIPIAQIFYMVTEKDVEIAWNLIKTTTPSGRCEAFVKMTEVMANFGNAARTLFNARYNAALCQVTRTTMTQWYTLLKNVVFRYAYFPYNLNAAPELTVDAFIRVVKAFRPAVYESYFVPAPTYPIIDGLLGTMAMNNLTNTQKGFLKNTASYFNQSLPLLATPDERLNWFSMKFSESIDLSYSYYSVQTGLEFKDGEAKYMDILMWTCQKEALELAYSAAGGV